LPDVTDERLVIDGGETCLVLGVGDDGRLHQLALGGPDAPGAVPAFPLALFPLVVPTFGEEALREPALRITHPSGALGTRLVAVGATSADHAAGIVHRVVLRDVVEPVEVVLVLRTWPAHGVIEQWLEVTNPTDGELVVHQAASAAPALPGADLHLTRWGGGWANEWTEWTERVQPGTKTVASFGGVRSSLYLPPVVLCSHGGRAREEEGEVLLASLEWGGDVRFDVELTHHRHARLLAGVEHRGAHRVLGPGERYVTPPAVLAWSGAGVGPLSRRLHRWVRDHVVRDGHRDRAIAFNNWEAMGFALDTASVIDVVDGAAATGAELFLLDDGWFGTTHPRDDDEQGLGDWDVDPAKFPDGLAPVIDHTLAAGLRFGLWVEPEMVNPRSQRYEQHPDWVIDAPGRERREERQQLVLDLCRPEVAEHVLDVIDRVLALHPGISYLKWDANRDLFDVGSAALPADRQSHLAVDRVRATEAVMAEVARRHPDVELMLCASGGGRSNLSDLRWFHELWTSDNTDPVDRVRIQWGASHLLPALVLGAHVTRWGAKPVPFGCAVAMSARFGFDLDPRTMDDGERAVAAAATESYRTIRSLVQHGDLHRLVSPVEGPRAALAYVHGDEAVVFAYLLEDDPDAGPPIGLPFLDVEVEHQIEDLTPGSPERGRRWVRSGAELAAGALAWPDGPAPAAAVWRVMPVD
jgi:alpha-galactosidase